MRARRGRLRPWIPMIALVTGVGMMGAIRESLLAIANALERKPSAWLSAAGF